MTYRSGRLLSKSWILLLRSPGKVTMYGHSTLAALRHELGLLPCVSPAAHAADTQLGERKWLVKRNRNQRGAGDYIYQAETGIGFWTMSAIPNPCEQGYKTWQDCYRYFRSY